MTVDFERMRFLWEEGRLKTIEIALEVGTTLDGVRGTARRRGWERGPVLRGKSSSSKKPAVAVESPIGPSTRGKKAKVAPPPEPPEPPKPREEPGWSTIFTRLAEEHAKMDRLLAETRSIGRLYGM